MTGPPLTNTRKWLITFSVMPLTIMQVLDSSATKDLLRQPAIGLLGFLLASVLLLDSPIERKARRMDLAGLVRGTTR
jgi:hypothetical protein